MSINDLEALTPIFKGADYVFHQAALPSVPRSIESPLGTHETCVTGTLNVLMSSRDAGVKRVVYAASSSAYGNVAADIKCEAMPPQPLSPYAVAKLAGEYYCQVFTSCYGLETVSLRYFNVFGPRQNPKSRYAAVIPLFISAILNGQVPTIYGDGLQSRDFTYVDNVVYGNLLAIKAPEASGKVINIATGGQVTLIDLITRLDRLFERKIEPSYKPERQGDVKYSRADISLAAQVLGYRPVTNFDMGLVKTVEWFCSSVEV